MARTLPRVASSLFAALVGAAGIASSCGGDSASTKEDFIASYCDKYMPCCEKAGRPSDGAQCRAFLGAFATGTYDAKAGEDCLAAFDKAAADPNFCDNGASDEVDSSACSKVFDSATGSEILDALYRSCTERRQTIVLVTHDSKAAAYADRVCVVRDGRILEEIQLGRRDTHDATPLIARLAQLGL